MQGRWSRRDFLTYGPCTVAGCAPFIQVKGKTVERPNIVLILVDDMGCDWVSAYGGGWRTPHVDALAQQGVLFETAWCTPICTPTRVELLTGKYPFRTGWTDHHDVPRWGGKGLDWEREVTFARILRDAGYRTAVVGKWQVNDLRDDTELLKRHGFDEHCMWTGYERGNPPSGERYWDPFLQVNGERGTHRGRFGPDVFNEYACDFIERHRDRPFLLYYAMVLVHGPFVPTPLAGRERKEEKDRRQLYAEMVSYMDRLVGRLMEKLDEVGVSSRTLVIFTADNGTPGGVTGRWHGCPAPPGKGRVTDFGVRVPFIVRAPWLQVRPARSHALIDFTDIFPTLLEVAGVEKPRELKLDGQSFVPLIQNPNGPGREWIFTQRGPMRSVRNKRYKLDSDGTFHDLWVDPFETQDFSGVQEEAVRRERKFLEGVMAGLPADAGPPFEGYWPLLKRQKRSKSKTEKPIA